MKSALITVAVALLHLTNAIHAGWFYSEYSGAYREWPMSNESMAETGHALPVYRTWPTKPYEVLGSLRHDNPNQDWRRGEIADAAREAKKKGGNAVVIRRVSEDSVNALTGHSGGGSVFRAETTALVIRFLAEAEIAEREKRRSALFKDVLRAHPNVTFSEDTGVLAIKFLLQTGLKETAPNFEAAFVETMNRVRPRESGDISGEWLFKATLKTSSLTAADERAFLGIAAVKNDGTNLVVVSKEGNVEFNFSGKHSGGKLDGQLGLGSVSAKADGVLLDEKISLTFQTLTGNGTAQGNIVLQRAKPPVAPTAKFQNL